MPNHLNWNRMFITFTLPRYWHRYKNRPFQFIFWWMSRKCLRIFTETVKSSHGQSKQTLLENEKSPFPFCLIWRKSLLQIFRLGWQFKERFHSIKTDSYFMMRLKESYCTTGWLFSFPFLTNQKLNFKISSIMQAKYTRDCVIICFFHLCY